MEQKRKRQYKKKVLWALEEEQILISIWEDRIDQFRGSRKKSHIYKEISCELQKKGLLYNEEEIKYKIHNLSNKYREEKRKIGPSGGSPSDWPHYNRISSFLGTFKSNMIEEVMEESCELSQTNDDVHEVEEIDLEIIDVPENECIEDPTPKKMKRNEILSEIQESNRFIKEEINRQREMDENMLQLQTELVDIEKERNEILRDISNNNNKIQMELLKAINAFNK